MAIKLYKFEVIKGREAIAEEWLNFLSSHIAIGEELLKGERVFLEAYFKAVETETTYVYMFFSGEDVGFSHNKALNFGSEYDKKHFDDRSASIDLTKGDIMDGLFYLNHFEDAIG